MARNGRLLTALLADRYATAAIDATTASQRRSCIPAQMQDINDNAEYS